MEFSEAVKMSPPWITFVHEVEALFAEDLDVKVKYDEENNVLKLYVADSDKASALEKLIPMEKEFGNVTLHITIIPPNLGEMTQEQLLQKAFCGNPALSYTASYDSPFGYVTYAVFQAKIAQFFNDQMDDINGNKSMLMEDVARDVFNPEHGVFFCTEAQTGKLTKPLGEWP